MKGDDSEKTLKKNVRLNLKVQGIDYESENSKNPIEEIRSMYSGSSYMLSTDSELKNKNVGLVQGGNKDLKSEEEIGLATFLDVFNRDKDDKTTKAVHENYQKKYNKFINSNPKLSNKEDKDTDNGKESTLKNESGKNIGKITFKRKNLSNGKIAYELNEITNTKKVGWFKRLVNKILKRQEKKEDVLVKLPMYDKDGNESDKFSIIVGIDKSGRKFISAPADIVIDDKTNISDSVKVSKDGKEYFMPITYEQYKDLHNEMIFSKGGNSNENNKINIEAKIREKTNTGQDIDNEEIINIKNPLNHFKNLKYDEPDYELPELKQQASKNISQGLPKIDDTEIDNAEFHQEKEIVEDIKSPTDTVTVQEKLKKLREEQRKEIDSSVAEKDKLNLRYKDKAPIQAIKPNELKPTENPLKNQVQATVSQLDSQKGVAQGSNINNASKNPNSSKDVNRR